MEMTDRTSKKTTNEDQGSLATTRMGRAQHAWTLLFAAVTASVLFSIVGVMGAQSASADSNPCDPAIETGTVLHTELDTEQLNSCTAPVPTYVGRKPMWWKCLDISQPPSLEEVTIGNRKSTGINTVADSVIRQNEDLDISAIKGGVLCALRSTSQPIGVVVPS